MGFSLLSVFGLTPVGLFILAAAGAPSPSPDLTGIAAIITAGIGIVGFLATLFRGRQNNKRVEEVEQAASYVKGFDALIKRLEDEIGDLREFHVAESKQWNNEKEVLRRTIADLRSDLRQSVAEHAETRGQLLELRGQIKGFLNREQYEEFLRHSR